MQSHFVLASTFAATLAVATFGFADPPAGKAGGPATSGSTTSPGKAAGAATSGQTTFSGKAGGPATSGQTTFSGKAGGPATSGSTTFSVGGAAAGAAGAADPPGSATTPVGGRDKSNLASPPAAALMKGHAAYMARDYAGAAQAYKEAVAKDGTDAAAYYFLGEAQIAAGTLADADASFAAALRYVGGKDDWRGKLLFVIAELRERQAKWPEAKKAWEDYAQFVATHPAVKGHTATATERVKVADARVDLETKYAPVRQRIEQRSKENATIPQAVDETAAPKKK
jgi:hypothetical protein